MSALMQGVKEFFAFVGASFRALFATLLPGNTSDSFAKKLQAE